MTIVDYSVVLIFIGLLMIVGYPLGKILAKIFDSPRRYWFEDFLSKLLKIDFSPQTLRNYLAHLLILHFFGFIFFVMIVMVPSSVQQPMSFDLAINTAISFITNTNWQSYAGELSLSPKMQMFACTVQNFLSASIGISVLLVFIRGLRAKGQKEIGNFWQDLIRTSFFVLFPLSFVLSIFLVSTGVPQTFKSSFELKTLEGEKQTLTLGPVASQVAIKQLGTNGGGYYAANGAHPYENPTPLSNFIQILSILIIPVALVFMFGQMTGDMKHAVLIYLVMMTLFILFLSLSLWGEHQTNPSAFHHSYLEGKESRFSLTESVLWSTATTAASNGSVNSMHSSLSPLSQFAALSQIVLGEIIFGGVGSGLYGMILVVILTVFLSGLMVGRTPEYFNKKIDVGDMKLVLLTLILPSCTILLGTAISLITPLGLVPRSAAGVHGFSEILYAWSSAAGNNGSAFGGLGTNTIFYNIGLALAMLIGRFGVLIPVMYLSERFLMKKNLAESSAKLNVNTPIFGFLLLSTILVVGALTFFPALLLGPILEFLLNSKGMNF